MPRRIIALGFLLASLFLLVPEPGGASPAGYYGDLHGHWSNAYIYDLWLEGVTDGYPISSSDPNRRHEYFRPDQPITRSEFTMLMIKVFQEAPWENPEPSFLDVLPETVVYVNRRVYPYIEAAHRSGIVAGFPDRRFRPSSALTREQALAILVRSLDLASYARSMSEKEVSLQLSRFRDSNRADSSLRHELAVAAKLKIVLGYPDGTLRPLSSMSRAEAATVVYRSCLVRATASPNPFSPDSDGVDETTSIAMHTLRNHNARSWRLSISDYAGLSLVNFQGWGQPPPVLAWDGKDNRGALLPPGTYYYSAKVADRAGQTYSSVLKPLTLLHHALTAHVSPTTVLPGRLLRLSASTSGGATSVRAALADGSVVALNPLNAPSSPGNIWSATYIVPASTSGGCYQARFDAFYPSAHRRVYVDYSVYADLALTGFLQPNPATAGHSITITAETAGPAEEVTATLPNSETVPLEPSGHGAWTCRYAVPVETPPGQYPILLAATGRGRRVELTLTLTVEASPLENLRVILTD